MFRRRLAAGPAPYRESCSRARRNKHARATSKSRSRLLPPPPALSYRASSCDKQCATPSLCDCQRVTSRERTSKHAPPARASPEQLESVRELSSADKGGASERQSRLSGQDEPAMTNERRAGERLAELQAPAQAGARITSRPLRIKIEASAVGERKSFARSFRALPAACQIKRCHEIRRPLA